ncbi:MAG: hypothetical protein J6Y48_02865 [Clostridia bacterium]|nr:hypothetical protein [Clostridia bacterium]
MGILNEGNGGGFYMPVAPAGTAYGNGGGLFGGDGSIWGLLLVLLLCGNGMWGGFGGGLGGMMMPWMMGMGGGFGMDYLYPWLNNSQNISGGFRDQQIATQLQGIQGSITSGFGDVQLGLAGVNQNICQTGNNITGAVRDGFYGAEIAANGRATANMQQLFGVQTAIADGSAKQLASAADLKYTIAAEECATRSASANNTRDIIDSQTRGIQTIMDKLCALELDGYKRENDQLRSQLNMATRRESQTAQNAFIQQGFSNEVDALYNRLNNCPVPSTPVYGRTPIFTCQNNGCGCGAFAA